MPDVSFAVRNAVIGSRPVLAMLACVTARAAASESAAYAIDTAATVAQNQEATRAVRLTLRSTCPLACMSSVMVPSALLAVRLSFFYH